MRNREDDFDEDGEGKDDMTEEIEDETPKKEVTKTSAKQKEQVIVEREINLSLINDKLNILINLIQQLKN